MMYSSTPFDSNNAFSGGGFMPPSTQTTDYGGGGPSPSKNRDTQRLLPLTVKQIAQSYESSSDKSNFTVDGVDVSSITLVGMVLNKAERTTDITFSVDDGTGVISCQRWLNEAIDLKEMEPIRDGVYVRLHGNLKGFQGKKHFLVFSARPVTNFNDIAYHFIECMYVHVYNTKLQKLQGGTQTQPQRASSGIGTNGSMGSQVPFSSPFTGSYGSDAINGLDQKVLEILHQPGVMAQEKGVHVNELAQQLRVPNSRIMESIRSLEGEGIVYATVDDFHFKSAVNG